MKNIIEKNLNKIYEYANICYPKECCGFIHINGEMFFATNIQDSLHEIDPTTYPRTSHNGYSFSIHDNRLLTDSFKSSNPVGTIFHSHPDVGAYFSEEDKNKALFNGHQIYPVSYLVIDVKKGLSNAAKLFEFKNNDFICTHNY